jgi:hypothetical protein
VRVDDDTRIRVGAFHATPATSRGPERLGVPGSKPWFHTRIAECVATWESPFVCGIDANTPRIDALDWSKTEFFWPSGRAGSSGEAFLVGPPGTVRHSARDLWRDWLTQSAAIDSLADVPPDGPLARSHRLPGGRWCRYDQVWATDDIKVAEMSYAYDLSCPDHALVTVTVSIALPS